MPSDFRGSHHVFDVNESNRLTINLATAGDILTWSNGEVKKPETINYRTLKAEMKAEIGDVERERELKLRERDEEYIKELEELEGRGAKKNEIERAEKAKNKDFEDVRLRYEDEITQLRTVWDSLRTLKPKQ